MPAFRKNFGQNAFNLENHVFPVEGNLYGMPEASFDFQVFSRGNLEDNGYDCYRDIDTSIYDFVEPEYRDVDRDLPEEEVDWDDPKYDGLAAMPGFLSQYVDDFLHFYAPDSSAESALGDSLLKKKEENNQLPRLLCQDWENVLNLSPTAFPSGVVIKQSILKKYFLM